MPDRLLRFQPAHHCHQDRQHQASLVAHTSGVPPCLTPVCHSCSCLSGRPSITPCRSPSICSGTRPRAFVGNVAVSGVMEESFLCKRFLVVRRILPLLLLPGNSPTRSLESLALGCRLQEDPSVMSLPLFDTQALLVYAALDTMQSPRDAHRVHAPLQRQKRRGSHETSAGGRLCAGPRDPCHQA